MIKNTMEKSHSITVNTSKLYNLYILLLILGLFQMDLNGFRFILKNNNGKINGNI